MITLLGSAHLCISPGIHLRAIAYPTPFDGNLTPEEKMSYVDPTMSTMAKVCASNDFLYGSLVDTGD